MKYFLVLILRIALLFSNCFAYDRFDCHPEPNADETGCEQRGCIWNLTNVVNAPWCYYPDDYGYLLNSMTSTNNGYTGTISQQSKYPSPYGNDIKTVNVSIYYETDSRLHIVFDDNNSTANRYRPPINIPSIPTKSTTNLLYRIEYTTDSTNIFGIKVIRKLDNRTIFDSTLPGFIMSNQFLQIMFGFEKDTHLYGWGERFSGLMLPNNYTVVSSFSHDVGDYLTYQNSYGVHPFSLGIDPITNNAFGIFILNSNAMELIITPNPSFHYRTIGGLLDIYILLGPTPNDVIMQYWDIIGKPFMPPYWGLGFHLCRWGYDSSNETRKVVDSMRAAGIPYDTQWNDIDYMDSKRDFTYDPVNYAGLPQLVDDLHNKYNMHYVNIIDPAICSDSTDDYTPYTTGIDQDVFVKDIDGNVLYGSVWPGETAFPDFFKNSTINWWIDQATLWKKEIDFDGWWIDMNEVSNFVDGSTNGCPDGNTLDNPPYFPVNLNTDTLYEKTMCMSSKQTYGVSASITSDSYNLHSLYGYSETIATSKALDTTIPNKRNFIISRSTYVGSGQYTGHWNGDNNANYQDMAISIKLLFAFNMFGIPLVGSDICGFNGDTTVELCSRWMEVGAFYPFSRNHNTEGDIAQDPPSLGEPVVSISKDILNVRYTLLPNLYTLFYKANKGEKMVIYPLLFHWPFIQEMLYIENQFMWGDFLMITPVLIQGSTIVNVTYPLIKSSTNVTKERWFNYFDNSELLFSSDKYDNGFGVITADTPLEKINLHIRGGSILTLQNPNGSLTTADAVKQPYQLLVALDSNYEAKGDVYLDDGETLNTNQFLFIEFNAGNGELTNTIVNNTYTLVNNGYLNEISILGIENDVSMVNVTNSNNFEWHYNSTCSYLVVSSLSLDISQSFSVTWQTKGFSKRNEFVQSYPEYA